MIARFRSAALSFLVLFAVMRAAAADDKE